MRVKLVGVGKGLRVLGVDDRDFVIWMFRKLGTLRFSSDLKGDVWLRVGSSW